MRPSHAWRPREALFALAATALVLGLAVSQARAASFDDVAVNVPIEQGGRRWVMPGHVCLPRGGAHMPLAVVNHGAWTARAGRQLYEVESCDGAVAQWFIERGVAAAFVLRLGYGKVDSPWIEDFTCTIEGFRHAGIETARQIAAIVDVTSRLPRIDADRTVVVGHSGGGWGSIAYDSLPHANVVALINMAGGRGGHYRYQPNNNCHAEHLIEAAGSFGKTAKTPMLWIYAKNDSFFGPQVAQGLAQAFVARGGHLQFVETPSFGDEGHYLFNDPAGVAVWGPLVEAYLRERGALPRSPSR